MSSSMSVDELDEILNQYASDHWMLLRFPSQGNREIKDEKLAEAKQAIHQYVTKKQIETRKEDWLWFADALMDRRIGADAALREFEKQLEGDNNA